MGRYIYQVDWDSDENQADDLQEQLQEIVDEFTNSEAIVVRYDMSTIPNEAHILPRESTERYVTKSGRILTDEDIQQLADEAEAGYDVDEIKARQSNEHIDKINKENELL